MKPRLGVPSDLEAVTSAVIRTMPLDPQWDYRFPYRHQYPADHYKFTRMLFEYFLDPSFDDWLVMVAEDSLAPGDSISVVSFGVFDISYVNKRRHGPGYKPQDPVTEVENRGGKTRRDANHKHFNEFWKGQIRAYKKYFAPLGPEQMHLQILGTLPEFQRRGHASSICRWAMDHVLRKSLKDMSVMASPMGYNLYTVLGFERVGTFYIQVPGEDERLVLQAMMYKPKIWETKTTEDGDGACVML